MYFMKLTKLFIAIFFLGMVFSCSDDESEENNPPINSIIGTWEMVEMEANGETTYQGIPVLIEGEDSNFNGTTIFTENPNEVVSNATFDLNMLVKQ